MPRMLGLDHTAIVVPSDRLQEARRFYSDVLGLQEASRPEAELGRPGIWYQLGDVQLHIQCREGDLSERSDRHIAMLVDNVPAVLQHLEANGIEVSGAQTLRGRERLFCRDPFGNRIEFVAES